MEKLQILLHLLKIKCKTDSDISNSRIYQIIKVIYLYICNEFGGTFTMKKPLRRSIYSILLLLFVYFLAREISTFYTPIIVYSISIGIVVYAIYDKKRE